jgi:elongation factor 1-gamma
MAELTIYTYPNNYRVQKALIAAEYNGVEVKVPGDFKMGSSNKTADFLAKFPLGKVPAMQTPFGPLYESGAITKYIARLRADTNLFGTNFYENALVEQWIDWSAFEVEPARGAWLLPIFKVLDYNKRVYEEAKKDIDAYMAVLDKHLLTATYLVGNQITLADIVVGTAFAGLYSTVLPVGATGKYINFTRWLDTLYNQPQFKKVLGDVKQAATEQVAPEGASAAAAPAAATAGKEKKEAPKGDKKKDEKPAGKKEAAPKAEKKADKPKEPAPKKEEDLSHLMGDEEGPKEPKAKNPLDLLPKSPMILDAVKKLFFSEKPYNKKFFDTLFKGSDEATKWDNAGYSVYTCEYKYNDEHKVYFLTCNLMGGFIQRVERLRKYGFGALNLVGETDEKAPWKLGGVWIFRGQDIPAEMTECDDSEHFNFTKVDVTKPAGQKVLSDALAADVIDGLNVLERRYFK